MIYVVQKEQIATEARKNIYGLFAAREVRKPDQGQKRIAEAEAMRVVATVRTSGSLGEHLIELGDGRGIPSDEAKAELRCVVCLQEMAEIILERVEEARKAVG